MSEKHPSAPCDADVRGRALADKPPGGSGHLTLPQRHAECAIALCFPRRPADGSVGAWPRKQQEGTPLLESTAQIPHPAGAPS